MRLCACGRGVWEDTGACKGLASWISSGENALSGVRLQAGFRLKLPDRPGEKILAQLLYNSIVFRLEICHSFQRRLSYVRPIYNL